MLAPRAPYLLLLLLEQLDARLQQLGVLLGLLARQLRLHEGRRQLVALFRLVGHFCWLGGWILLNLRNSNAISIYYEIFVF